MSSSAEEQAPLRQPKNISVPSYLTTVQPSSFEELAAAGKVISESEKEEQAPISPEASANVFQIWTIGWMDALFRTGFERQIQEEDLYRVIEKRRARVLGQKLMSYWSLEKQTQAEGDRRRRPSLLRAIVRTFWRDYLLGYIFLEIGVPPPPAVKGYGLAISAFLFACGQNLLYQRWEALSINTGLFIRTALIDLVFRKATMLSAKSHLLYPDGSIINLMSTDISRIDNAAIFFTIVVASPIYLTVVVVLLVRLMGPSALLGAAMLMLTNPIQAWGMARLAPIRKLASEMTDSRIRLLTEILSGIRAIKLFAVPIFASALSFVLYALLGNELKPEIVFPALALYAIMRVPLMILPYCYTTSVDAYVAIGRIQEFLLSEDAVALSPIDESAESAITIEDADFVWEALSNISTKTGTGNDRVNANNADLEHSQENTALLSDAENNFSHTTPYLQNINLRIARGALVAIVGSVGSGKSSLLQAIVGNMTQSRGTIIRGSTASYASQTPWIQNATIRDNILFDKPFDEERYWRVIRACCLEQDLASFPHGDLTEIGERGVNLSGGQKARLSLARSVYFDAGTVIMDDPLSAVDAHVGKRLWRDCVQGELKGKTRVIATHQLHVLPTVDQIIFMKGGVIAAEGTYQELMAAGGEFSQLMVQHGGLHGKKHKDTIGDIVIASEESGSSTQTLQQEGSITESDSEQTSEFGSLDAGDTETSDAQEEMAGGSTSKLMTEEERAIGAVSVAVYLDYFKMAGLGRWSVVLFCLIGQQVFNILMNYWLSLWSDQALDLSTSTYILVFVSLAITQVIILTIGSQLLCLAIIRTAGVLHARAFDNVIRAPLSFYDTTPLGRILNRFSKDVEAVDSAILGPLNDITITLSMILGSVILTLIYFPLLFIAIVPMGGLYYGLSIYYRSTSREIKRLDSTLRSVLYSYFAESLTGMGTLRAYDRIKRAIVINQTRIDLGNRAYYLFQTGTRWISLRVQLLGALVILLTSVTVIGARFSFNAALAGLVLSYTVRIAGDLSWVLQCIATMENNMNSVERLVYYTKNLPQEPARESLPDLKPAKSWPKHGAITFKDVSMRYRPELPQVLRKISFDVKPGHKVGVVGRTGAGKSSLIHALFLLTELDGGQIFLDGIDTQAIGTADLRSHIAIIPQDPVLFQGAFRYNLDPLGKHSEQELWQVLETSDLKAYVQAQEGGLDAVITAGGKNLSAGQRQLVCLARALLAKSKVVVLDEATASVDLVTDALIQKAIRVDFAASTVITIAHRINTIIDYDRVLVVQQGQVAEYDTPVNLLRNPSSTISALVSETGIENAAHLRSLSGL
ncbi:hypothetical protein BGZ99_001658 [Dissophora globulifera]|uniref:Uncharacterized protein n=1 Tax=Dissophora globulifera TaxID=979702 RepID=A0A9P6RPG7_9FUNG|nr:hypothetical protein BGZ99_001658 [Dissophora globulifera]